MMNGIFIPIHQSMSALQDKRNACYGLRDFIQCFIANTFESRKIWSESFSRLQSISNTFTTHRLSRIIQEKLLINKHLSSGWIRVHTAHIGNETADSLARRAVMEGISTPVPLPLCYSRNILLQDLLYQLKSGWDSAYTGRLIHELLPDPSLKHRKWSRFEIMFFSDHGHFTTYLHRFHLRSTDLCNCEEVSSPIHFATSCPLTSYWQFSTPICNNLFIWE
ncbi:hypothetical protein AVEN_253446-1 [Araneus ventricosus]|uniref:Uncharacterized protein n=1 Tax=Araneus ventricosus TaxID=182803 RepID=A0A4Y2MTQ0_ARAVE|nr:hypothetical protein AVEN_253446-1 [Araneus ventricosus]